MAYKFKVGDRVTWGNRCFSFVIKEIADSCVNVDGSSGIDIEDGSSFDFGKDIETVSISELELIEPKTTGPVRENVVKEIVPGEYGRVVIDGHYGETINFSLLTSFGAKSGIYSFDAQELRSAAETFLAIADALEGK